MAKGPNLDVLKPAKIENWKWASLGALLLLTCLAPALSEQMQGTGVSLKPPHDWTQTQGQNGAVLTLLAPKTLSKFSPTINVRTQETRAMTPKDDTDLNIEQLKEAWAEMNPIVDSNFNKGMLGEQTVFSPKSGART